MWRRVAGVGSQDGPEGLRQASERVSSDSRVSLIMIVSYRSCLCCHPLGLHATSGKPQRELNCNISAHHLLTG